MKGVGLWLLTMAVIFCMSLCHIDGVTAMPEDFGRTAPFLKADVRPLLPAIILLGVYVWLGWCRMHTPAKWGDRIVLLTALALNLLMINDCLPFIRYTTAFAYCVTVLAFGCILAPGLLAMLPADQKK